MALRIGTWLEIGVDNVGWLDRTAVGVLLVAWYCWSNLVLCVKPNAIFVFDDAGDGRVNKLSAVVFNGPTKLSCQNNIIIIFLYVWKSCPVIPYMFASNKNA